jgi:hypothetical protein
MRHATLAYNMGFWHIRWLLAGSRAVKPVSLMPPLRRTPRHDLLREILVAHRDRIGMTQVELAAALHRPQSLVSRTEQGERRLDVIEFIEWTEALGCQASDILAELGRREAPSSSTRRDGRRKRPTPS